MASTNQTTMEKCQIASTWHQRAWIKSKRKWQQSWRTCSSNMLWCWSNKSSSIGLWSSCTTLQLRWMPGSMKSRSNIFRCRTENWLKTSSSGNSCKHTQEPTARESSILLVYKSRSKNYGKMSPTRSFSRSQEQLKARVSMGRLIQQLWSHQTYN